MALLTFNDVTISHGGPRLLDAASFQINPGEHLGLIGRNGAGKTTLLRLATGELQPDAGTVDIARALRLGTLPQEIPPTAPGTVHTLVHAAALTAPAATPDTALLATDQLLTRMALPPTAPFDTLSAGLKRRALLATQLAAAPDLLLLDEPTNHLDATSIEWLENFLADWRGALLLITHDRRFLQRTAHAILDLDRGKITRWDCPYEKFLQRKEAWLDAQATAHAEFDKKLAREEAWLRQGVKARRCRNEGRVRALQQLRATRAARRDTPGLMRATIATAPRGSAKIVEAINANYTWPTAPTPILRDFNFTLMRGDRIGLLGPNGAGKTTLLKILLGQLPPDTGEIKTGPTLSIAYYDQMRAHLDPTHTVAENLAPHSDHVTYAGARRHVISYLQDFLFDPDRARSPVSMLSGGERNRLLLAKLFLTPANVLVLDEPTNDLDIETLELLEELLSDFDGTVLLVSHDRAFLDNVTTSYLVFEGNGQVREFNGDYETWKTTRDRAAKAATTAKAINNTSSTATASTTATAPSSANPTATAPSTANPLAPHNSYSSHNSPNSHSSYNSHSAAAPAAAASTPAPPAKKLTNKENAELAALPARIESLEAEQAAHTAQLHDPDFYRDPAAVKALQARLPQLETEIQTAYARWAALDARA